MELTGNYWKLAPEPVKKDVIMKLLFDVFKEMKYNHYAKKIVVDYVPQEKNLSWCIGSARSGRFGDLTNDPYVDLKDPYHEINPSDENYTIWIGIPQVFDACNFLATVEHKVEHLQNPRKKHSEMMKTKEMMEKWKDETGSDDCLR